jgi:hypothetical protein
MGPASALALKEKPYAFDSELSRMLKEDSEAQAKVKTEIVGLDFDPVLGGQDACERYEVRKVTIKGDSCFVRSLAHAARRVRSPTWFPS